MRRRLLLPAALLSLLALPARAQVNVGSTERPPVRAADDRDLRPDPPAGAVAARVIVAGAPRSYQVVRVAVPAAVPDATPVAYRARGLGSATLISRADGQLPPGTDRAVSLVIGIPARARAGRIPAAEVSFSGPGDLAATVIVEMDVTLVRDLQVDMLRATLGARPGQVVRLPYQVLNRGNARDTITVAVELPWGWSAIAGADTMLVVEPGAAIRRELVARTSKLSSSGSYTVRVASRHEGVEAASDRATVDIAGPRPASATEGFALSTALSLVSGSTGGRTAVIQYSLGGPIWGKLGIRTDFATSSQLDARNRYRLSSLGQLPQPPNFTLYSPTWRATVGAVGFSWSDVLGLNVGGRGASYSYDGSRYAGQFLVSRPAGAAADSGAPLNGALRLGRKVGDVWVSATGLRMQEAFGARRRLEAIGASVLAPRALGGQLTSEVAFRRFIGGSGVGLLGDYTRVAGPEDRLQFRAAFAPGGTDAFALARTTVTGAATRRVADHLVLDSQAWYTSDGEGGGPRNTSIGATLIPQVEFSRTNVARIELGTRSQSFSSGATSFGMREHRAFGAYRWSIGTLAFNVGAGAAVIMRGVDLDTTLSVNRSSVRSKLTGDITRGTVRFGSLSVTGGITSDRSNLSTLPRQAHVGIGFADFPIYFTGGFNLRLTGLAEHVSWFGDRPSAIAYHGEVAAELPFGFVLGWSMDRRPFESVAGAGSWATALRIRRNGSFSLPSPLRRGNRSGRVFQDLNGNGIRDDAEPGISGIMVLRGSERVSTDDEGRYHFPAPPQGNVAPAALRLEPRSLPPGWLQRPMPLDAEKAAKVRDIGLLPTANVRVIIEVSRADLGAAGALDLTKVLVTARDSAGRLWLAAREPTGTQVFPALPPGRYKLEVDPSAVGVPLTLKDEPPSFEVGQSREASTIRVELATRKVRMFRAPSPSSAPATSPASTPPANAAPPSQP